MPDLARLLDATPVVQSVADRNAKFPLPAPDQRVFNKGTGNTERWDLTAGSWIVDSGGVQGALGWFNVKDGSGAAKGDGVADDTAPITTTITAGKAAGGGTIYFPLATYFLGNRAAFSRAFDLGVTTNIAFVGAPATFVMNTTDDTQTIFFRISNPENIEFRNIYFRDTGTNLAVDWHGADCIQLYGTGAAATYNGVRIIGCRADSVVAFVILGNTVNTDARIRDIRVEDCVVRNSYYGVVCQENGDGLRGNWRCENVRRAYFPYGVTDHSVEISIYHDGVAPGAESAILIKRYERNTKDLSIKAHFSGSLAQYANGVTMEHQPVVTGTGVIEDISIDLHISEDVPANAMKPVRFRSLTSAGVEEVAATTNRWDKISLRGSVGNLTGGTGAIFFSCTQAVEGKLYLDPSFYRAAQTSVPHYPGFVVRVAHDREFRTLSGSLTAQTLVLPLAGFNANPLTLRLVVFAHDDKTALVVQNATLREDVIVGYNASAGDVGIQSVTNLFTVVQGTEAVVTYSVVGETIVVSFAGAAYNNANAFARVELQFVGRGPLY